MIFLYEILAWHICFLFFDILFKFWLDVFALWNFAKLKITVLFSSVHSLSRVQLFATPWIAACQASLPITSSWSSPRLTSTESVMPSSHLILCRPLLLLPPIPPSIRVFSNESTLCMRWPKYWVSGKCLVTIWNCDLVGIYLLTTYYQRSSN